MRRRLHQQPMMKRGNLWMVRQLCSWQSQFEGLVAVVADNASRPHRRRRRRQQACWSEDSKRRGHGGPSGCCSLHGTELMCLCEGVSQSDGCGCDQWHKIWDVTGNKALLPCPPQTMGISESTCHHKRMSVLEFQRWLIPAKVDAGCL